MEVLSPTSLEEALRVKAEYPEAVPIQGGTDVMVELNFDRRRPEMLLNLNEVGELRGWSRENSRLRLASGLTYTEAMEGELAEALPALAEASRTVGSPQIRARGTIGGNLGTASPAGDALPPLLVEGADVELASVRGVRTVPLGEFLVGPKRNAAEPDELITAAWVAPSGGPQTFMKVGPRNAMVIAVCSLAVVADPERGELRAAFGSAGPVVGLVSCPLVESGSLPDRVAEAASPIDDHRGVPATCAAGAGGSRAGASADMRSFAFGSLPWGKPCFPHGPLSSRGRCARGNLPVPLEPLPTHRPRCGQ